jgi:hypothetical protein
MRASQQHELQQKPQTNLQLRPERTTRTSLHARPKSLKSESGYTLLMVVFIVATLLLFAVAVTPSVVIEGRRVKEQEDVWRGNQYVRAIRLYYQKTGRYPQTVDDLTKPDAAGNHFLRKTYSDLMNPVDGKWRFIYVSQSGQLIGSVRYHSLQEMAIAQGIGTSLGTVAGGAGSGIPTSGQGAQPGQGAQTGPAGQSTTGFGGATPAFGNATQPQNLAPLEPVDGPVLGGFLIGVGGKLKTPSVMVYQGGKTYYEWEFIWNPLAAGGSIGAPVAPPGGATGAPGTSGANGAAGTTPTGTGGSATPGTNQDGTTNPAGPSGSAPAGGAPSENGATDSNGNPAPPNPAPPNPAPANPDANSSSPDNSVNPATPADPNAPPATPSQPRER